MTEQEFTDLYERVHPALLGFVRRRVRDEQVCEELAQEAFAKAWQHRHRLSHSDFSASRGYVYRTAENLVFDFGRHAQMVQWQTFDLRHHDRSDADDPLTLSVRAETVREVRAAVATLDPLNRELTLAYAASWHGARPLPELQERFGLTRAGVKARMFRNRNALRPLLEGVA